MRTFACEFGTDIIQFFLLFAFCKIVSLSIAFKVFLYQPKFANANNVHVMLLDRFYMPVLQYHELIVMPECVLQQAEP